VFREHHGLLRTSAAMRAGVNPATLYALRDAGLVTQVARGLYQLREREPLSNPDLATGRRQCSASSRRWTGTA